MRGVASKVLITLALSGAVAVAAEKIPPDELPKKVLRALEKRFPGARIVEADIDRLDPSGRERTVKTYELTCDLPDREIEVLVTADGTVLDEEFSMRPKRGVELTLSAKEVDADLEFLGDALDARFAYRHANDVDLAAALARIRKQARKSMKRSDLALALQTVIAQFIDGHARVSDVPSGPDGRLPFLVETIGDRYVAFTPRRDGFVAKGLPWIESIDGLTIDEWVERLGVVVAVSSPGHARREALRWLRRLPLCRQLAGVDATGAVKVVLRSEDGKRTKKVSLPLGDRNPTYGDWPREVRDAQPTVLDGGIGYLPLPKMDDVAARRVSEWMPKFAESKGLIVDVRGNGGGSRDALLALYPWLMGKNESPRVLNVAKYRLWEGFRDDHMDGRFMRRADDKRLTKNERKAAAAFLKSFEPEWQPPKAQFSVWHVLIVSPSKERYGGEVVVLMDDRCFSATDIFLGALKGRPNVTLMGRPSGGGSAYSQRFTLPRSGLEIRCASMASFTPPGRLYDLHGIEPDVPVSVAPEYFLRGNDDELLARALEKLRR